MAGNVDIKEAVIGNGRAVKTQAGQSQDERSVGAAEKEVVRVAISCITEFLDFIA
jgi:hypothetical protein